MSSIRVMQEEAEKFGITLTNIAPSTGRWSCKCVACGDEHITRFKPMTDIARVKAAIEQEGWAFPRNKPVCPTCIAAAKKVRQMGNTTKIETVVNPKLQRKVYALLDDHFNETTKLYVNGWSDKKIAEAAETSEQFVASVREEAYGKLAEDPAITAIRNEIADLEAARVKLGDDLLAKVTEIGEKVTALHKRLDSFAMKKVS